MSSTPALRLHVHLPIIDQMVLVTVPAALCTQPVRREPSIEVVGPVDPALDHWTLWLLADGALGSRIRAAAPSSTAVCESSSAVRYTDADWSTLAQHIECHEAARARHARCDHWDVPYLHAMHAELGAVRGSDLRDVPAWFGGPTPATARYVAPQSQALPELLDDLVRFANSRPDWPFLQAVLLHYQIVMMHPFRDGNGRLARLLAACVLARARRPLAPLYAGFAMQRWGHDRHDDALDSLIQGDIEGYIAWWVRAHAFASTLRTLIEVGRAQRSDELATALLPNVRLATAMRRAVMRSPAFALSRFAAVHGLSSKRQQQLADVLAEHGWRRVDTQRWLCTAALACLIDACRDVYRSGAA